MYMINSFNSSDVIKTVKKTVLNPLMIISDQSIETQTNNVIIHTETNNYQTLETKLDTIKSLNFPTRKNEIKLSKFIPQQNKIQFKNLILQKIDAKNKQIEKKISDKESLNFMEEFVGKSIFKNKI